MVYTPNTNKLFYNIKIFYKVLFNYLFNFIKKLMKMRLKPFKHPINQNRPAERGTINEKTAFQNKPQLDLHVVILFLDPVDLSTKTL